MQSHCSLCVIWWNWTVSMKHCCWEVGKLKGCLGCEFLFWTCVIYIVYYKRTLTDISDSPVSDVIQIQQSKCLFFNMSESTSWVAFSASWCVPKYTLMCLGMLCYNLVCRCVPRQACILIVCSVLNWVWPVSSRHCIKSQQQLSLSSTVENLSFDFFKIIAHEANIEPKSSREKLKCDQICPH